MTFLQTRLDNGLTLIGEQNPTAQSLAVGYFVRTGARDESPEIVGVSHFLEHMAFKGTERRSAEEINREFDELGAQYNAFTSEENTVYFGRVLPEFQERLVDLLTDMMRPALRQEDFDVEKKVILEEIAMYRDRPVWVAFDAARTAYHGGHPLGHPVLGTPETIGTLSREAMLHYFETRYSPTNMTFVLTGNFGWEAAVEQVGSATASWKPFEAARHLEPPTPRALTRVVPDSKLKQAHLVWLTPGVSAQDESRYAANVLAQALGDDVGSRFYWELVDPGLADSASLSHEEEDGTGLFAAYVSCKPENVPRVVSTVRRLFEEVTANGLSEAEIERAKQKIASALVLGAETPMGRLVPVGLTWVYRREYLGVDASVERYLAVSQEEIATFLSHKPFSCQTLVALGPLEGVDL